MNGTKVESFLDTNVLVYAYDSSEKDKHECAKRLLSEIYSKRRRVVLSTQTLSEFFTTVTKKIANPLPLEKAQGIIQDIVDFEQFRKVSISPQTVLDAIEIQDISKTSYWDALIAATMKEQRVFEILTEDVEDFKKVQGIIAKNPFSEKN